MICLSPLLFSVVLSAVPPTEGETSLAWVKNVAEAKEKAAAEHKDLFIDFTGSDWCGWCKRLDAEVFDHASFVEAASKDFVFLFLDFPQSEELIAQVVDPELNDTLMKHYGVQGFPTIVLADANGRPYAKTGYQDGGPEKYLEHLGELEQKGAAVRALNEAKEVTAEHLKAAFPVLVEHELLTYPEYAPHLAKAKELDKDGSLGLKEMVLQVEDNLGLQELIEKIDPQEGPPWEDLANYLVQHTHCAGPMFLQIAYGTTLQYLIPQERFADACALLERVRKEPMIADNAEAQTEIGKVIEDCKAKQAEKAGEGGSGGSGGR